MSWKMNRLRACVLGSVLCGLSAGALATVPADQVGEALQRSALSASQADKAVLLGSALAGNGRLVVVGERGLVLLSDDQGASWRQAQVPVSVSLTAVRFAAERGVAVGHGGVVLTSEDAGEHWALRLDGRRAAALALDSAIAERNPDLLGSAKLLVEEGPDKPFLDVSLDHEGRILVVGAYGLFFASEDFGQSWSPRMNRLDNPSGYHLYSVRQRGRVVLLAGERGLVLRSEDGGEQFQRLQLPYEGSLFTAELVGDEMLVAGLKGSLLRSRDGGHDWQRIDTGAEASSFTASTLGADGTLYLVNQAGQVLGWSRESLVRLNRQPLPALNGILPINPGKVVLLSNLGVSTLRLAEAEGSPK